MACRVRRRASPGEEAEDYRACRAPRGFRLRDGVLDLTHGSTDADAVVGMSYWETRLRLDRPLAKKSGLIK
jgi:hypothetical protein